MHPVRRRSIPRPGAPREICAEDQPLSNGSDWEDISVLVAACEDDSGAACAVEAWQGSTPLAELPVTPNLYSPPPGAYRLVRYFPLQGDTVVRFTFANGVKRRCDISLLASRSPEGQLTSFSTDASGLVTTGVWRKKDASPELPGEFVAVGGGATDHLAGSHVGTLGTWGGTLVPFTASTPTDRWYFAVGLKLAGQGRWTPPRQPAVPSPSDSQVLAVDNLMATAPGTSTPVATVAAADVWGEQWNGFSGTYTSASWMVLTASLPIMGREWFECVLRPPHTVGCPVPTVVGWSAETRPPDHPIWPVRVVSRLTALPRTVTLRDADTGASKTYHVRSTVVSADGPAAVTQRVDLSGLRGRAALTGIGLRIDWRRANANDASLPFGVAVAAQPRADRGGASIGSGQIAGQAAPAPSVLSAYAVGVHLVEKLGNEPQIVTKSIRAFDLCRADPRLAETSVCRGLPPAMAPAELCREYPDLGDHGYCK